MLELEPWKVLDRFIGFYTKEHKAAAVARRGTEKASATVATMATREQVQEVLQRKKEGARNRRAVLSSFAKSTKTNEQKKVRVVVPAEVPHDTRICVEDLVNTDFDESDVDEQKSNANSRQKSELSEADFERNE